MVVDDDPDLVVSLRQLFEMEGYEVTTAENGWKCVQLFESGFKGILILDLMMPVMDGIETIKTLVKGGFHEGTTIIILTAKRIQGDEFNEVYPFISQYMAKPFNCQALLQTVRRASRQKVRTVAL